MKRPQPDIGDTLRNEFIGNLKTVRGLRRLWGTEIVNGVEVFTPRQYYHKESDRSTNFEKLFKFLGAYDSVIESNNEGLRSAWMYFNKNNGTDLVVNYNDFISDNLNKLWWDPNDGVMPTDLTLTTSIVIQGFSSNPAKNARIQQIVNPSMPASIAIPSIINNYEELWGITNITQEGVGVINKGSIVDPVNSITTPDEDDLTPDDPWLATIARYALRDSGIPCNVKSIRIGTIQGAGTATGQRLATTFVIDIEIPYITFSTASGMVTDIAEDIPARRVSAIQTNSSITSSSIRSMDSRDLEDDNELVTRSYDLWEDQPITNSALTDTLWFKFLDTWYLRVEPFKDPRTSGFTYKELSTYILSLIDTGYKKKKVPWYKKALAVVLVVVAFIIAYVAPGAGTKLSVQLLAVAKAVLVASLVLTLALLAFAVTGMAEWAAAFSEVSKWIEPLVLIASVVLVVTGIGEVIAGAKEAARKAAEDAGKEYIEQTALEIAQDLVKSRVMDFVDFIVKGAVDVFSGNLTTNAAMAFNTKMLEILNYGLESRSASLGAKNRDLKAEYEKLTEEMDRESNTLQGFAKVYAKPATADWSMYASQFDLPYERGGGNLALGNIQRTTKQALRKADYDDSAFAGILLL
jgi:hypothetical protein